MSPPSYGDGPHRIMDPMADISRPFLRGAQVPHQVEYFSEANLRGACISISIGILVYVLFIRRYLMETGEDGTRVYVDRWPAWLNLEDRVYRPLALTVLPFLGAVLARCVNGICEGPLPLFMKRPEKKSGGGTGGVQPVFQAGPGCKASAHDLFQHGIRVHDAGGRAYTDDGICAVFMRNLVGKKGCPSYD